MERLKIYAASPYGFAECTQDFMNNKFIPALEEVAEVINPWVLTTAQEVLQAEKEGRDHEFAMEIGRRNEEAIDECDIIVGALDGQELDPGTTAEIGNAVAKGKKAYGYRSDFRQSGEKGVLVNLQVQYFIERSGGAIASSLDELKDLLRK